MSNNKLNFKESKKVHHYRRYISAIFSGLITFLMLLLMMQDLKSEQLRIMASFITGMSSYATIEFLRRA